MEESIEMMVKECSMCQKHQNEAPATPLQPWKWPARPWTRIHIDYAGPFMNSMFLVIVDAHSQWVEIFKTNSETSGTTIQ